ncbi:MAG TPA: ADP-ribosylglycohydrolase family protein [Steroidobacteraceae bacterium]|nr:ADP-ribosylglycohydrolase family protein [Steroidobacteraceae bacterium]
MRPPIPNSYWVQPGRVLAGEHPHGGSDDATRERIESLLAAGVRAFIDLTEAEELPGYRGLLPTGVGYHSFPLPDHSVPRTAQQMREVQATLEGLIAAGTTVYVHCRAGIGRTGITIGCYLRERGESPGRALAELNRLWRQNARAARWPSIPETPEQEQFILEWEPRLGDAPLVLERYRGCLMGLAIADVCATAPEGMTPAGWSDDTALAICAAESLLACGGFDGRDQIGRIRGWARDPVAAGSAPGASLRPPVREVLARAVWNKAQLLGSHDPSRQDASPLSRCAAAALFAAAGPGPAGALGADLARITHQAPVPVDACRLLSDMIAEALRGQPRSVVMAVALRPGGLPLCEELRLLAQDWNELQLGRRRPPPGILGALDRAVRCFARSRSFADGLERALAGSGAERDAVAASYGALAGAWYGAAALTPELRSRVAGLNRLTDLAGRLFRRAGAAGGPLP